MTLKRRTERGFSLLEALIALAILSLAIAIVVPDMSAGLASTARRTLLMDVERYVLECRRLAMSEEARVPLADIEGLPTRGAQVGTSVDASGTGDEPPEAVLGPLPRGWRATSRGPMFAKPDGRCEGGDFVVHRSGEPDARFSVDADCDVAALRK